MALWYTFNMCIKFITSSKPIMEHNKTTMPQWTCVGVRLYGCISFIFLLFTLICRDIKYLLYIFLTVSQDSTQGAMLLDGRAVGWYLSVLRTCGGSEWHHVNRAPQYQIIYPSHSWQLHFTMRIRGSQSVFHIAKLFIYLSIFSTTPHWDNSLPFHTSFFITCVLIGARVHTQSHVK